MKRSLLSLSVGQYLPGSSLLHRLDARVKLLTTMGYVVALFLVESWLGLAILAAGLVGGIVLTRVPLSYLLRGLRPLLLLLLLTFVIQVLTLPGEPLARLGPFVATREGIAQGGFLTVRLVLLLLSGTLLTLSTTAIALTDGFEWFLRPLGWVGLPGAEVALMMTIALGFIPTLLREVDDLVKAQKARGLEVRSRDPRRIVQGLLPLTVPLFVLTFKRADDLALAMSSRCYHGGESRTRYREVRLGRIDLVAAPLILAWLSLAVVLGRIVA